MTFIQNGVDFRAHYGSWAEFVDAAAVPRQPGVNDTALSRQVESGAFTGVRTFEDAVKLARDGWPEVSAEIERLASRITAGVLQHVERPEVFFGYEGVQYDVGRLLDGEPEHWQYWSPVEETLRGSGRVCRILYNVAISGGIDGSIIRARGAAVGALCRALDYVGIRAEVTITDGTGGTAPNAQGFVNVTLKQADQDIDYPVFAYAIAHPSTLRRLVFSVQETFPATIRANYGFGNPYGSFYGYPADLPAAERAAYDIHVDSAMLGDAQWTKPESAIAWVLGKLAEQGVTIREEATACTR